MTKKIPYNTRQLIISQALTEIQFARDYKQGKIANWKLNENMYYSRKANQVSATGQTLVTDPSTSGNTRANVDLGQMSAFVHTLMSKIDTPMTFKFIKRKESQLKRVEQLNSLRSSDQQKNDWDIKDLAGKKQALIYGRAIYSYFADSMSGYESHLDSIDVYDFLIDPSAGGIDKEKASYIGDYGVVKSKRELKEGIKSGIYLKTETERLIEGNGNTLEENQEEMNKKNRTQDTSVWSTSKEIGDVAKYKFWRWGTTYEGERYYLLLSERGGTAIEVAHIEDKFESGLWWYWTWACTIDLTEFWTPSHCDYVRELMMAQAISINQVIDNSEQINKPQRVVNVGAIENLAELAYRRNGLIKVKKDFDVNKAIQTIVVPVIQTPLEVFDKLEGIKEKASGVTAASQGDADNNAQAKLGIYKGNEENSADRFGFLNRSYSFGYRQFAKLYVVGVKEHLIKKVAIDILGPDGVEIQMVSKRDIFRKDEEFNIMVEAANAETALSQQEKTAKISFLQIQMNIPQVPGVPPIQNMKKAYEIMAGIAGFDEDTIRQLQDTTDYGDAAMMSEAERDIERVLDNEKFLPNQNANTAYKQRFIDYMQDNQENISDEQFVGLSNYVLQLDGVIERNMTRQANAILFQQRMKAILNPPQPPATPAPSVSAQLPNGGMGGVIS